MTWYGTSGSLLATMAGLAFGCAASMGETVVIRFTDIKVVEWVPWLIAALGAIRTIGTVIQNRSTHLVATNRRVILKSLTEQQEIPHSDIGEIVYLFGVGVDPMHGGEALSIPCKSAPEKNITVYGLHIALGELTRVVDEYGRTE